jgi:heme A synthase
MLAEPTAAVLVSLGREAAGSALELTSLVAVTFAQGLVGMWLYAGRRARGPSAAAMIGLALWALSALYSAIYFHAGFPGALPNDVVWWPVAWGLIEYPLAIVAGAAVYREH